MSEPQVLQVCASLIPPFVSLSWHLSKLQGLTFTPQAIHVRQALGYVSPVDICPPPVLKRRDADTFVMALLLMFCCQTCPVRTGQE